jgi:hypothetical protein
MKRKIIIHSRTEVYKWATGCASKPKGRLGKVRGVSGRLRGVSGRLRGVSGRLRGVSGRLRGVSGRLRGVSGRLRGVSGVGKYVGVAEQPERGKAVQDRPEPQPNFPLFSWHELIAAQC